MAFSALLSCETPTTAFRIRIVRICLQSRSAFYRALAVEMGTFSSLLTTAGSTNALHPPSSSNRASTKEMAAEPRRIRTSWSLNCSRMSSHRGVGGSSGIA